MKSSRRQFIRQAAGAAALAAIGHNSLTKQLLASEKASGNLLAVPVPFTGGKFTIEKKSAEVWPGAASDVYTLTGSYPGPLLRIGKGQTLSVNVENKIDAHVSIHWHGMELPANMDGHPMDAIMPGMNYTYQYPMLNRAGTYFFHSHTHGMTGEQVYKGMAGILIVEDDEEQALDLPRGEYDIPLLIQDLRFDANKKLIYEHDNVVDEMLGHTSDNVAVNGTVQAYLPVRRGTYRLRLINASNARIYKMAFSDGRNFHVIASDGGLLEKPAEMSALTIAPAERYEILVDFSSDSEGSSVTLRSLEFEAPVHMGLEPPFPQGMALDVLRFDIGGTGVKKEIPQQLSTITRMPAESAEHVRVFEMNMTGMNHTINSTSYDMHRIDEVVPMGRTEIWEFKNMEDDMLHPMHVHGVQFQILSRDGSTDIPPHERGWKDTVLVNPFERVRVIMKFDKYDGVYLMHCHNLEHEDAGMMLNFRVDKTSSVSGDEASGSAIVVSPNPCNDIALLRFPAEGKERSLNISDMTGKILFHEKVSAHIGEIQIPVWQIPSGTYFCSIGRMSARITITR